MHTGMTGAGGGETVRPGSRKFCSGQDAQAQRLRWLARGSEGPLGGVRARGRGRGEGQEHARAPGASCRPRTRVLAGGQAGGGRTLALTKLPCGPISIPHDSLSHSQCGAARQVDCSPRHREAEASARGVGGGAAAATERACAFEGGRGSCGGVRATSEVFHVVRAPLPGLSRVGRQSLGGATPCSNRPSHRHRARIGTRFPKECPP